MTINQKLEQGSLRCPCSRIAVRIVARSGICPRCLDRDREGEVYIRPNNPDAKYAEKFFAPDYGSRTDILGITDP